MSMCSLLCVCLERLPLDIERDVQEGEATAQTDASQPQPPPLHSARRA